MKGQVEHQVGFARDNIFKPRLRFKTPRTLFADILRRIDRLRPQPPPLLAA
jgi:hypothetical protein